MVAKGHKARRAPQRSEAEFLKTVRRSIRVMGCFTLQEPRLSLAEIAERVGLPRSTTHRILATLREEGMLEQDGSRELYRLGLKVFEMGSVVLANMELHREALPFIEELVKETGETVHLGVFDGSRVVSIEKMNSPHNLVTNVTIGKGAPAHCTGCGKVLLAFQPDAIVDHLCQLGLKSYTPQTITDPISLRKELAHIRTVGYAVDNTEHEPGLRCVTAPIRDYSDNVIAALSISGPATRITEEVIPALAKRVKEVSKQLSARLGFSSKKQGASGTDQESLRRSQVNHTGDG